MSISLGRTTFLWPFNVTLKDGRQVSAAVEAASEEAAALMFSQDRNVAKVAPFIVKNDHIGPEAIGRCMPLQLAASHFQQMQQRDAKIANLVT